MRKDSFHRAGVIHLVLCKRLKSYIESQRAVKKEELVSHKDCEFGKWLYSEGLSKNPDLKELQELDKVHFELHIMMKKVFDLVDRKDIAGARKEYVKLDILSKKIITLLTSVGLRIGEENE